MLSDIGPHGYHFDTAVATLALTPLSDRAAVIRKIYVDKVSADDVWRIKCAGKEVGAYDVQTDGVQQPLSAPQTAFPSNSNMFDVYERLTGEPLIYPVPQGQSLTIASDGGATADILLEFSEHNPSELSPGMMNHPNGNRYVCPLVGYIAASLSAAGEAKFDTQVGPTWVPNIFVDNDLPVNWRISVLALFLQGGGVNTFSGSADHQSITRYLSIKKNGQLLFTRDSSGGIPLVGSASATGSANTVIDNDLTPYPPFQDVDSVDIDPMSPPLVFGSGDQYQLRLDVTGSLTGGASYEAIRQLFLCDIRSPG